MRRAGPIARVASALLASAACHVPDVDLAGRACPCAEGYVCDTARNACVTRLPDGGGVDDAGGDATSDAASGFCASHPGALFCADFDDPSSATSPFGFDAVNARGARATLDTALFVSPPGALACALGADVDGASVELTKTLVPQTYATLRVGVDVYLDPDPPVPELVSLDFSGGAAIGIGDFGSYGKLRQHRPDGSEDYGFILDGLPRRAWIHIDIAIDAATKALTLTYGPSGVPQKTTLVVDPAPLQRVAIGAGTQSSGPAWTARFDDVLVELR